MNIERRTSNVQYRMKKPKFHRVQPRWRDLRFTSTAKALRTRRIGVLMHFSIDKTYKTNYIIA